MPTLSTRLGIAGFPDETIVLSKEMVQLAEAIGEERQSVNASAKHVREHRYGGGSAVEMHVQGAIGELAFLRMHELPLDGFRDTRVNCAAKDRGDATFGKNGARVDVKTTRACFRNTALQVCSRKVHMQFRGGGSGGPDAYAFMHVGDYEPGKRAVVTLKGFAAADTVISAEHRQQTSRGQWVYRFPYRLRSLEECMHMQKTKKGGQK